MWSSRNTPNDWTKLWSSCVRHVQMDIMLPLPTSDARTSISAKREKKPWVSLSSFKGFYRLFFASKRKIHVKRVEDITLVRDFQLFDVDYIFFRWLVSKVTFLWWLFMLYCCHRLIHFCLSSLSCHTHHTNVRVLCHHAMHNDCILMVHESPFFNPSTLVHSGNFFFYNKKYVRTWLRKTQRDGNDWSRVVRGRRRNDDDDDWKEKL